MNERAIIMQQLSPRDSSNMQYHPNMQHQLPSEVYRPVHDQYQENMDADMYLEPFNNNSYVRQKPLERHLREHDSGM